MTPNHVQEPNQTAVCRYRRGIKRRTLCRARERNAPLCHCCGRYCENRQQSRLGAEPRRSFSSHAPTIPLPVSRCHVRSPKQFRRVYHSRTDFIVGRWQWNSDVVSSLLTILLHILEGQPPISCRRGSNGFALLILQLKRRVNKKKIPPTSSHALTNQKNATKSRWYSRTRRDSATRIEGTKRVTIVGVSKS